MVYHTLQLVMHGDNVSCRGSFWWFVITALCNCLCGLKFVVVALHYVFGPRNLWYLESLSNVFNMMTSSNGKFSVLLDLCVGISSITGEFPSQRQVTWSFDVFLGLRLNKRLSKQSWGWWFEMPSSSLWCHCNGHLSFLTGINFLVYLCLIKTKKDILLSSQVKQNTALALWWGILKLCSFPS